MVHRNTYRGKNLGNIFTEEQKAAIRNNTFDDLYIGDYWEINGFKWLIADINYWLGTGSNPTLYGLSTPHLVIIPNTTLIDDNVKMNSTQTTNGGYVGSELYKSNLGGVKQIVFDAFGQDNILKHVEFLSTAVTNGYVIGANWVESDIEIPNQLMIFGTNIYPQLNGSTFATYATIDKVQLSLFKFRPDLIRLDVTNYWLRDVVSDKYFGLASWDGLANYGSANGTGFGVRPVFGLIGENIS